MSIFSKQQPKQTITFDDFLYALKSSSSFTSVIENHSTVQFIVNTIADTISIIPLNLYVRQKGGGATKAVLNPLFDIVRDKPNPYETTSLFFSRVIKDSLLNGNAYIKIIKNEKNEAIGMMRLEPNSVEMKIDKNEVYYLVSGEKYTYDSIIHIPSKYGTKDILLGVSPLEYCKEAVLTSATMREYLKTFFNNFIASKLHLEVDTEDYNKFKLLKDDLAKEFIDSMGKVFITPSKWKVNPLNLQTNQLQEVVENRTSLDKEICRAFKFPIDLLEANKESVEAELFYATLRETTLLPITTLIEEKFRQLLPVEDRNIFFFEYDYKALMSPSVSARYANYQIGGGGISFLTVNEIRKAENLPPLPSEIGDSLFYNTALYQLNKENVEAQNARNKAIINPVEKHNLGSGDDK